MRTSPVGLSCFLALVAGCGGGGGPAADAVQDEWPAALDLSVPDKGPQGDGEVSGRDAVLDAQEEVGPQVCPPLGTLVITEVMYDPKLAPDATGEYFEVYNTGNTPVDVRGFIIQSGTEKHVIGSIEPLEVAPKGYLLFARSAEKELNGGITPGYVYEKVVLSNTADSIAIYCQDFLLDGVAYNTTTWPHETGKALVLDPSGYDPEKNDDPANWCLGYTQFGAGDFGSPGAENQACGQNSCGDGTVQAWEECDDKNDEPHDGCEPDCKKTPDQDGDGVHDFADNCPKVANPDQADSDGDGIGDACDNPDCGNGVKEGDEECDDGNQDPGDGCEPDCTLSVDTDGDGVYDSVDNCPDVQNADQADADGDGIGDVCDSPECGNGVKEGDEECDDGDTRSGDGCSRACKVEHFEPGSVIVTEFMYNPKSTDDSKGEYVELYNTLDQPVDIAGWILTDEGEDAAEIMPESGELVIAPHDYVVLGRSADKDVNLGIDVDFAYGNNFSLGDTIDKIVLKWGDVIIDKVVYQVGEGKPFPKVSGRSLNLSLDKYDADANDDGANWCPTSDTHPLPLGDFGTPGQENETCETPAP